MAIVGARLSGQGNLERAIIEAFKQWAEEDINNAHWDDQFRDSSKWQWDQETRRRNGETVFSPRDIYDLGALYESGINSFRLSNTSKGAEAYWHWDAKNSNGDEYASYVHYGTNFMDGRAFTDDISIPSSFWRKAPGMAFKLQMQQHLTSINAR